MVVVEFCNSAKDHVMEEILHTLTLILFRVFIKIVLSMTRYLPLHSLVKAIHLDKAIVFVD